MKHTMQYSVGGDIYDIPFDQDEAFRTKAGDRAEAANSYRVGNDTYTIPQSQDAAFKASVAKAGKEAVAVRSVLMDDGTRRDFTASEMSRFLRSPEYRESADYTPPEQGSPTWAGIKGALGGAVEGAWEGGKAGLAKAAWALPQVGTGMVRAVGNIANGLGNAKNGVGNALINGANAADEWMERTMPTSTAERLGYEDWGTKTGDFFGNAAGMAVKFAPAGGASLASKVFTEAMLASDGLNAFANTYDEATRNGMSAVEANTLGMASGLVNYFGGKALLKAGGVGAKIENPLLRELAAAGAAGGVMGEQSGANQVIGNLATGKPTGEGVAGAVAKGVAEGVAFHGVNMIPRLPKVVRQTREHFDAAREWIIGAAKEDPGMLSDLMDPTALTKVIKVRREGGDISRSMGKEIDLPGNMSREERNEVVDSIIHARDAQAESVRTKMDDVQAQSLADAVGGVVDINTPDFEKVWGAATKKIKDATELDDPARRAEIVADAVKEVYGAEAEGNDGVKREAVFNRETIEAKHREQKHERDVAAMERDAQEQREGMTRAAIDEKIGAKAAEQKAQREEFDAEVKAKAEEEYGERMAAYEEARAKRAAEMKKTGKATTELPEKPDYDAILAEQKAKMDAADAGAEKAAHEERGNDLAQAFADWKEESIKAQKSGKKSPEAPAEVEDARAKAESDAVVQRLNAEWQKAKTPAERNAIKAKLMDRLKEMGIGAKEKAAASETKEDAQPTEQPRIEQNAQNSKPADIAPKPPKTPVAEPAPKAEQAPAPTAAKRPVDVVSRLHEMIRRVREEKDRVHDLWPHATENDEARLKEMIYEEKGYHEISLLRDVDLGYIQKRIPDINYKIGLLDENNTISFKKGIASAFSDMGYEPVFDGDQLMSVRKESAAKKVQSAPTATKSAEAAKRTPDGKDGMKAISESDRIESLRSDPAVRKWVEDGKRGEVVDGKVSPRNVVDYLRDQVDKAVTATKRVFSDAKVDVKDRDFNPLIDEKDGTTTFKAADGRVVGAFDPATKHVTLYRGADAKTVYHELIGHGVEDWAARNNRPLHDKLIELAKTAPKELADAIRERYPDADEATLAKEIIANIAEGNGLERIKLKEAPKAWYAKAYVAVRDALLGFMEKIGLRRVDLSKIDEMSPNEVMDHLMDEIAKGKTLGEIGAASDGKVGRIEKWADTFWKRHASLEKIDKNAAYEKQIQPGKEAAFQNLVYNKRVGEMKKMLTDGDIAIESVDEYMKATAALERNKADREAHVQRLLKEGMSKRMAEEKTDILINKLNNGTSGMSDEVAEATIKHYEGSAKFAEIKKVADFLWKMQDEGMMERVRAGLLSQKEYDGLRAKEPHHVPFRSAVDETTGEWVNDWARGMDAPEFMHHQGRFSESGSPSAWMLQEFSNAFMRGIENDTRLVLAKAVETNPSLGKIVESPTVKEYRGKGSDGDPNVVSYKTINDKGESVTRHIYLNGERGAMAASSYTNAGMAKVNKVTARAMRMWAATATELSPTFALRNFSADNLGFAKMVLLERGAKEGSRFMKDYAKNHKAVAREVWDFVRNGNVDENSTLGQYMKSGAMIGGFQREGYADIRDAFSAKAIAKEFAAGRNRGSVISRYTLGLVKAINGYSELANRVADFKTRLEWGEDMNTVVKQSREDFVDFNQKGNLTPITNTLWMFSNSTIGATMRQLQSIDKAWRTPQGRRALLGLAAYGVAEAVIEHFWNAQQDAENEKKGNATGKDVTEHTRKVSLYFRNGGNVFRLPVHEDPLMRLIYAANAATRWALGDMDGKTFAKELGGDIVGDIPAYFGMGTKELAAGVNTWLPSTLQPFVQHLENKDYAGRPIRRPKFNEAMPDSQNGRKSTSEVYKWFAKTLNAATGGNAGRAGAVDIAPETAKLVTESVVKNMGKDLANAADTGWRILTGDFKGMDSRRVPVVRDLVRKTEGNDNRFFDAKRKFDADKTELKQRDKERSWGEGERRAYYDAHPWLRTNGRNNTAVERLINGHTPQNGGHQFGINELRRMENGEKRVKTSKGYEWRPHEWTDEQVEKFKAKRLEKQALVLKLMGED